MPIFDLRDWRARLRQSVVYPEQGTTLTEIVIDNRLLEEPQIEAYTALIRELGDKDVITGETLLDILAEMKTHASELADFVKRSNDKRWTG